MAILIYLKSRLYACIVKQVLKILSSAGLSAETNTKAFVNQCQRPIHQGE